MVKQEKQVTQELEPPPLPAMEAHTYSDEFMNMMFDYAYEALRQHLLAVNTALEAREILENLVVLHNIQKVYQRDVKVAYYWNQSAGDTIGRISNLVIALGGYFAPAPMDMIK